ncbi:hypothetical protein TSUD_409370 [Trifolium subterraneum]|uniref:Endonuclease/exonuclease/phosphatase domain-containing protein n=1 Tax=Trifolium subterraneum TaxID=3900 RepID=A0A2Z6P1T2_TRISU|nr:hypothetical protein TSUD_409370 [Trifolium subterraneum]
MWDTSEVEVWSSTSCEHVLWCHGRFLKTGEEFYLANVYAPCGLGAKQSLWNSLLGRILLLNGERVCVCGDFNAVRSIEERRSARAGSHSSDHIPFNRFIDDAVLIDLPLSGRKFTWYKGDGLAMSRIDRFLLSEEWCLTWPNCVQVAQLRGLSDHCPLVLEVEEENWGPRPSRMLKCWKDIPGYQQFVRDKWKAMQIVGWGGFVLKEKFKMIRLALKEWHAAHSQNLPGRIESLKVRLAALEVKGEAAVLSEAELEELHGLTTEIHSLSRRSASICWQQSRSLWLKEGDANSKYFHSVVASRRRGNAVSFIQVDGVTTEGVQPIRQAVFEHFASHFKESHVARPGVDNLQFKRLTLLEGGSLTKPFSLEEVKTAVWDCDSFKSPGPGGINFGFIKDLWSELQDDVMRFIADFHRNGKLTKGWDTGGEAWEWRRHLWAWEEEMLGECQVLLHDFTLQAQLSDTWIWRIDPASGYSVRGAYQLLTSHPSDTLDAALDLIWHKQRLRLAWLDAEEWRQLNTYFFHAVPLVLSGYPLGRGLASHRWIRIV